MSHKSVYIFLCLVDESFLQLKKLLFFLKKKGLRMVFSCLESIFALGHQVKEEEKWKEKERVHLKSPQPHVDEHSSTWSDCFYYSVSELRTGRINLGDQFHYLLTESSIKVVAKSYMDCSLIVLGEFRTWELEKAHTSKSHTVLDHQTNFWDLIKVIVRRRDQINLSPCFSKYFDKKIKRKNIWPKK